ncbi:MAG: ROK family protein [Fusobacterium sp.]|uniref:ROK family protein n=1 Tax=Fusobacterium sp. TaxID=68766 RepID=UPI0026DA86E7|nr:ROK family protein [Fusobacterium sp.]MDO4691000.1 ROK family protein [Fusobacterium sp.]
MSYYIGIDLGGTNTKIGVLDSGGNIVSLGGIKTDSNNMIKSLEQIWSEAKHLLKKINLKEEAVKGIGIGIPGPVINGSIVTFFSNFNWEKNVNLKKEFERITNIETRIANDANIIAQGEAIFGAAKNKKSSITVAIGTGIGGGIFLNGNLISGNTGVGGEIGHMKLEKNGRLCGCGQRGCFEAYASAKSLIKEAKERLKNDKDNLLFKEIEGNIDTLEAKHIFDCAKKGDKFSLELIDYESEYLAMGIGSLLNIINPEILVISGGISLAGNILLNAVREKLKLFSMPPALENFELVLGELGNEAGIKGAAALFYSDKK